MMGAPPRRIDILTEITGVDFEAAWQSKAECVIGGLCVPFIGRERLIDNKRASGRPQDLADVASLAGSSDDDTDG